MAGKKERRVAKKGSVLVVDDEEIMREILETLLVREGTEGPYTGNGGVSCPLPATIMLWGQADNTDGVSYAEGQGVRDGRSGGDRPS